MFFAIPKKRIVDYFETMQLTDLGWNPFFDKSFEPYKVQGFCALRIIKGNREKYVALGEAGEFACEISGKFRFEVDGKASFPTAGDWVVASVRPSEKTATIHALLPRKSSFSRKVAGTTTDEQVIASNIDTIFIVCGLDLNFNLRRIERYLSLAWESGAVPVILLNKVDLCVDAEERKLEVESIALGVDVYTLSASQHVGTEILNIYITTGKTVAFLGSSGVGKSTIINTLLGTQRIKTNEVSELGSRGRHTTTSKELILLPSGGMVIDTPGMRELQVWGDEEGLKQAFDDIMELAKNCKFRDCTHQKEPGCAVQKAISNGTLDVKRLESFLKLQKEFTYLSNRQTMTPNAVEKARWKEISVRIKNLKNDK